jgi:hypothetical protein
MTEFFQGMGTLCPRWLPGHLLSVEESRLARRPPLKAARSGLYASERIHHWDWFEFEANAKTFKPWTGRFFGRLFCGAMERKTLPVICVLLRASGKTVPC